MKKIVSLASIVPISLLLHGCLYTKSEIDVKPVEIKPMHITIDVNVKVEKQLDDFFGDLDKKAETLSAKDKATAAKETDTNKL